MNILQAEQLITDRLRAILPVGTPLAGTFDAVDLTDEISPPYIGQLRLERILAAGAVAGSSAAVELVYSFSVYADLIRCAPAEKSSAAQLLVDAGNALVGWEYSPSRTPTITDGLDTGFDGRVLRLSVGVSLPAFFTA